MIMESPYINSHTSVSLFHRWTFATSVTFPVHRRLFNWLWLCSHRRRMDPGWIPGCTKFIGLLHPNCGSCRCVCNLVLWVCRGFLLCITLIQANSAVTKQVLCWETHYSIVYLNLSANLCLSIWNVYTKRLAMVISESKYTASAQTRLALQCTMIDATMHSLKTRPDRDCWIRQFDRIRKYLASYLCLDWEHSRFRSFHQIS